MSRTTMKIRATCLKPGNIIPPPSHERTWLWRDGVKRMMTVISVSDGQTDKGGLWLNVKASFPCPYGPGETESVFRMRPASFVSVQLGESIKAESESSPILFDADGFALVRESETPAGVQRRLF